MNIVMHSPYNGMAIINSHYLIDDLEEEIECKVLVEFNYAYMGGVDEVEITKITSVHGESEILKDLVPQLQWKSDSFERHIRKEIKRIRIEREQEMEAEDHDRGLYIGLAAS